MSTLPSGYLGLPLGVPYKTNRIWEGVEERFKKKNCFVEETIYLEMWKVDID